MEESFETQELKEQVEETIERVAEHGKGSGSRWTHYLALSTAVIAVLAAIASLEAGSLSNEAILYKNEAVLFQAKASDAWSYYQAKGIKAAIYSTQAGALQRSNATCWPRRIKTRTSITKKSKLT